MKDVKEQKQNDNGEIIEMKQGQVIKIPKNGGKAWLTLFYSLPQEFVSKRPVYLNLPRCPYEVLRTDKYDSLISGIHEYYEPEQLVGKTCVAITNLPTRMMMGIPSEGMLISAVYEYEGHEGLNLLMLDDVIPAGAKLY